MKKTSWQFARDQSWCAGWIAGFVAAVLLFSGRYDDYAKDRDKYLSRKGWAAK